MFLLKQDIMRGGKVWEGSWVKRQRLLEMGFRGSLVRREQKDAIPEELISMIRVGASKERGKLVGGGGGKTAFFPKQQPPKLGGGRVYQEGEWVIRFSCSGNSASRGDHSSFLSYGQEQ